MLLKNFTVDRLNVKVYDTRENMGEGSAKDFHDYLVNLLLEKDEVNIIFAAAPSQRDFLYSITKYNDINWNKVNVFHMDEYLGMNITAPQSFARFVKEHVADKFPVKAFYGINGANGEKECERYTKLLREKPVDIVVLGIGENGHIAFNDPWVADFWDRQDIKVVPLDEVCRNQQVNDKCFEKISDVPKSALTLTIPTLLRANAMFCIVPCQTKANAVNQTVNKPVDITCPASALRLHKNAYLYCDKDSGKDIL